MIESPNERETLETFMALCTTGRLVFLKNATEAYDESELSYNSSVFEQVGRGGKYSILMELLCHWWRLTC